MCDVVVPLKLWCISTILPAGQHFLSWHGVHGSTLNMTWEGVLYIILEYFLTTSSRSREVDHPSSSSQVAYSTRAQWWPFSTLPTGHNRPPPPPNWLRLLPASLRHGRYGAHTPYDLRIQTMPLDHATSQHLEVEIRQCICLFCWYIFVRKTRWYASSRTPFRSSSSTKFGQSINLLSFWTPSTVSSGHSR